MKKNILKYVAILICFASIITVFTACSNNDEELLFEKGGKIYYRKEIGDEAYELVTDANGVTVVDEQGNMLWKVTDANGEDQTHPVSFPAFLNDGKTVSCQQFTIKCPKGWESTGNLNFILKNAEEKLYINYSFIGTEEEIYATVDEQIVKLEEAFKTQIEEGTAILTRSTSQVAGRDATKFVIETLGENPSYQEVYYVDIGSGIMHFYCSCDSEDKGFDFKAILDTIEYRV